MLIVVVLLAGRDCPPWYLLCRPPPTSDLPPIPPPPPPPIPFAPTRILPIPEAPVLWDEAAVDVRVGKGWSVVASLRDGARPGWPRPMLAAERWAPVEGCIGPAGSCGLNASVRRGWTIGRARDVLWGGWSCWLVEAW